MRLSFYMSNIQTIALQALCEEEVRAGLSSGSLTAKLVPKACKEACLNRDANVKVVDERRAWQRECDLVFLSFTISVKCISIYFSDYFPFIVLVSNQHQFLSKSLYESHCPPYKCSEHTDPCTVLLGPCMRWTEQRISCQEYFALIEVHQWPRLEGSSHLSFAFLSTAFYSKTNPPCWLLFLFSSIFARVPAYICCSEKKNSNILFVINISMSTFPSSFLSSARCLILFYFCPKMFAQCTNLNSNSNLKSDRNLNTKIKTNTSMKIIMRTNMIINIIIIMNTIR